MQPIAETNAPPSKEQLLAVLKDSLEKVAQEVTSDVEPERSWSLRNAQTNDLYRRSLQYLAPSVTTMGTIEISSIGSVVAHDGDNGQGMYDYCLNIYRGYCRKFTGAIGQRAPNVAAVPDDPTDDESMHATRMADIAAAILRSKWDVDQMNLMLAMYLWQNGTTFGYTPYVADGTKYGWQEEPELTAAPMAMSAGKSRCVNCGTEVDDKDGTPAPTTCPSCGGAMEREEGESTEIPQAGEMKRYAKGSVELFLCSVLTVSTPYDYKRVDDLPWLEYSLYPYKGKLIKMFPQLRGTEEGEQLGDSAADSLAKTAQDSAFSPGGVPNPNNSNRWNFKRLWITPDVYETITDEKKRKLLQENFKTGCKISMVKGKIVELEDEKLSDVWAVCFPEPGEGIWRDGIGQDMVQIQDLVNDIGVNIPAETFERGVGQTIADSRVWDTDQWNQKRATPCEIIPAMPAVGGSLSDSFFQIPSATMSNQAVPWLASMVTSAESICGTTPAIYGGDGGSQTAHEAEIKKNAAMQQLLPTWTYIRGFYKQVFENGVRQLAKYGTGTMTETKKGSGTQNHEARVLDLAQLSEEGWHFEVEEAIPMTFGQRRDNLMWLLEKPEPIINALGLMHPMNIADNAELLGMTGRYFPGEDDREKALDVIQQLTDGKPMQKPAPDGSMSLEPSIPIDDFDNHGTMADIALAWMISAAGRGVRDSNEDGFMNVVAWQQAHREASVPPPPPPLPPPPPRLSISAKVNELQPEVQQQVEQVFGIAGAPQAPPPVVGAAPSPAPGTPPDAPPAPPGPTPFPAPGPGPAGPPPGQKMGVPAHVPTDQQLIQ